MNKNAEKDGSLMRLALAQAQEAGARGEVPVGAVITDRAGAVLAANGNRIRELKDPTAHAEMLVLREAASRLGDERLIGCDIYVTLEPCAMCAGAISLARLRRLYYAASDEKTGACAHGVRFFETPSCHHRPEIYDGIGETEASHLLRDFFQQLRSA